MARRHEEAERLSFASRAEWRDWLARHHATSPGVFVIYPRKASGLPGPAYEDLIEEALCFGWIDGTLRPVDDQRTSLYFCPRRKGGIWAASNKARVERLRAAGLMTDAGEAVIARAIADGSWTILDRSEALELPDELAEALAAHPGSAEAYEALAPSMRKQLIYQVDSAKRPDTRNKRAAQIAADLAADQSPRP
jgi:uncharacterized protein YdeI (YjbR/CyaY-like superfamily)